MKQKQKALAQHLKHIARQKFTWFVCLVVGLTITAFTTRTEDTAFESSASATNQYVDRIPLHNTVLPLAETAAASPLPEAKPVVPPVAEAKPVSITRFLRSSTKAAAGLARADELIAYAEDLLGTPYIYGGTTPKGFDCSGFIYYVYSNFDHEMERSSRAQSTQGTEVEVAEVLPGDLLFFTGTKPSIREVGHVGIVISEPGQPVSFIHSSSNGGVKISELEGYYTTRFMFAKRI